MNTTVDRAITTRLRRNLRTMRGKENSLQLLYPQIFLDCFLWIEEAKEVEGDRNLTNLYAKFARAFADGGEVVSVSVVREWYQAGSLLREFLADYKAGDLEGRTVRALLDANSQLERGVIESGFEMVKDGDPHHKIKRFLDSKIREKFERIESVRDRGISDSEMKSEANRLLGKAERKFPGASSIQVTVLVDGVERVDVRAS